MIPKKIHYCWFGRNELPALAKKCIASWKKYCPDYEIIEWNEDNFDLDYNGYTRYCYDNKKWAFLSDFVRLVVVAEQGGIYFDTDVELGRTNCCNTVRSMALKTIRMLPQVWDSAQKPITPPLWQCGTNMLPFSLTLKEIIL